MKDFIDQIANYANSQEEASTKEKFLTFIRANDDCFLRSNLAGHVTASAFVVDTKENKILLIHHKKLNKWLQPGGHCDGDNDTLNVAIKEVFEETGVVIIPSNQVIKDLDIHTIPERKEIPEHEHFDVRYIFEANSKLPLVQNHETNDLKWISIGEIKDYTTEESILRVIKKI